MTLMLQICAAVLMACLSVWLIAMARGRKPLTIIEYDSELSTEQIEGIREHLRSQGLVGAVIVSGTRSVHVWPPPPEKYTHKHGRGIADHTDECTCSICWANHCGSFREGHIRQA